MVKDVFVRTSERLVQGSVDVEIMVAGIEGRPGEVEEEVVVRLVSRRSTLGLDDWGGRTPTSEVRQEIHCHV